MKNKILICFLFLLTGLFLSNVSNAQRITTVNPTPTPTPRDLVVPNQTTEKRLALVIGNANYQFAGQLRNPGNDARDMSANLKKLGFTVIDGYDLTLAQMEQKLQQFGNQLKSQKGVGLFYFAGHGIQFNGANYLIPVDANIKTEQETKYKGLNLGLVLDTLENAKNGFNIVILDACRNNPFARSWNRDASTSDGLAQTTAPTGTFIAYATAPGSVAADGAGRNGTFTAELLKQIQVPNLTVEQVFKNVRQKVTAQTNNKQTPWDSSSLVGDFYFAGKGTTTANSQTDSQRTETSSEETVKTATGNLELIKNYYASNQLDEAIKESEIFLSEQPDNSEVNLIMSNSLWRKGLFQKAMPFTEKAFLAGERITFPMKRQYRKLGLTAGLDGGKIEVQANQLIIQFDEEAYTFLYENIEKIELKNNGLAYWILIKGKGTSEKGKVEKKEFNLYAPTAVAATQEKDYGNGNVIISTVIDCGNCELWTQEVAKFIVRVKTGVLVKSK